MSRVGTGQLIVREREDGRVVYALRYRAAGRRRYETLGDASDGWTMKKAEASSRSGGQRSCLTSGSHLSAGAKATRQLPPSRRSGTSPTSGSRHARRRDSRRRRFQTSSGRSGTFSGSAITRCRRSRPRRSTATSWRRSPRDASSTSDSQRGRRAEPAKRGPRPPRGLSNVVDQPHTPASLTDSRGRRSSTEGWTANPASGRRRRLKATKPAQAVGRA